MGLFDDPASLLPGLMPAAWRGVPFHMIDAEHSVGRRIITTLYPGLDLNTHQDLGRLDGPIPVSGLVIGPDYVAQARRLEAAFARAGAGTLLHPWRGQIRCVLLRPARISFASDELMVARIEAEFDPEMRPRGPIGLISSLAGLLGAAGDLLAAARALALDVLALPMGALGLVAEIRATAGAVVEIAAGFVSEGRHAAAAARDIGLAFDALTRADLAGPDAAPAHLASAIELSVLAIRKASMPLPEPSIGPANQSGYSRPAPRDPRAGALAMIGLAGRLAALAPAPAAAAIPLAAEMMAMSALVELASAIPFESRQDAQAWRARVDDALAAHGARIAAHAAAAPGQAALPWRRVAATRAALARDINEAVGRLPSVISIETGPGLSAWLIAQSVAGDNPQRLTGVYADIMRRNRLRHPGRLPGGRIEVLP
jgi:hypothetical protein